MINGTMDFDCGTIWASSNDAWWGFLCYGSVVQVDGKRFNEADQRQSYPDRANNNKANRQFQAGKDRQQDIFREGCYHA